jgi:hypothetical protein
MKKIIACLVFLVFTGISFQNHLLAQNNAASALLGPRVVEDGGTGPYSAITYTDSSLVTHTIFRPADLSVFGDKNKLPIIAWGNGACANSPWEHVNFLSEVASHGFLVIAIGPMPEEGQRGGGRSTSSQLLDAVDWAIARNGDKSGVFYGKIDVSNIAVSGMSCGGLQALEAAPDPRVTTAIICNSGILGQGGGMPGMPQLTKDHLAKLHTPVLYLLGGESDIAYNNGMDDFNRINHVPVFVGNMDVGHGGTYQQPHGGEYAVVATAWVKWQLKGDNEAGKLFTGNPCLLSESTEWTVDKKNMPSQNPNFHIYLCFGQSNMAGSAPAEAQDSVVDARFQMMSTMDCPDKGREMGNWYTATPPLSSCNTGISPADYFGRTLIENLSEEIKVGVINVSVPGCRIELYDKENYSSYVETAPDWMLNWINNYGGNPYARLVEMAKLAQKDGVIKGILLHQGESNPNDSLWTQKVKDIYDNLLTDLNLNPEETPLLAGELLGEEYDGKCAPFNQFIAQLPKIIPNAHVISSKGCPGQPDGLHFSSEGYRILGKRYGEKMLLLLKD